MAEPAPAINFAFRLPPEEAIKYFGQKGDRTTWHWWKTLANADALHQAEILSSGYGYSDWVSKFRALIKNLGLDETCILDDLARIVKNHPIYDYLEPVIQLLPDKSGGNKETIRRTLFHLGG
ncbi:MAG: hypothetical protein AB1611_17940 [bacterium]